MFAIALVLWLGAASAVDMADVLHAQQEWKGSIQGGEGTWNDVEEHSDGMCLLSVRHAKMESRDALGAATSLNEGRNDRDITDMTDHEANKGNQLVGGSRRRRMHFWFGDADRALCDALLSKINADTDYEDMQDAVFNADTGGHIWDFVYAETTNLYKFHSSTNRERCIFKNRHGDTVMAYY